jgi:hypothetical protein
MKKYIEQEGQTFSIKVSYNKGGLNYFTYKVDDRGYYLTITPVELQQHDGYTTESFTIFSGLKKKLKTVKRQSKKAQAEAVELSEQFIQPMIDNILEQLKSKTALR